MIKKLALGMVLLFLNGAGFCQAEIELVNNENDYVISVMQALTSAGKRIRDQDNLSKLGEITIRYNEKSKNELPFKLYQVDSKVTYTSPPNIWIETGRIDDVKYARYFADGWNPMEALNQPLVNFLFLDENMHWPIAFFNGDVSDREESWVVGCTFRPVECIMMKGTIHVTLIQRDVNSISTLISLQESNIKNKNVLYSDKAVDLHGQQSIQVDQNSPIEYSYINDGFREYENQIPSMIEELQNGKTVKTSYDVEVKESLDSSESVLNQKKQYKSTVNLVGFKQAYQYMLWSFNILSQLHPFNPKQSIEP